MSLHYQSLQHQLHHGILQQLISATSELSTATSSHTESSSLSYYPAPSLFYYRILYCIQILYNVPSTTSPIQLLPLMSPSSSQTHYTKLCGKTGIFGGLYRIYIFVFFNPLHIFVPRLEILLLINHYYRVYI